MPAAHQYRPVPVALLIAAGLIAMAWHFRRRSGSVRYVKGGTAPIPASQDDIRVAKQPGRSRQGERRASLRALVDGRRVRTAAFTCLGSEARDDEGDEGFNTSDGEHSEVLPVVKPPKPSKPPPKPPPKPPVAAAPQRTGKVAGKLSGAKQASNGRSYWTDNDAHAQMDGNRYKSGVKNRLGGA